MERRFKGIWIPKEIYLNKDLSWTDKILLIEIDSLSSNDKGCYASNHYFADFLGISVRQVQACLKKLEDLGLITKKIIGGYRYIHMKSLMKLPMKKTSPPHEENFTPPHEENFTLINTNKINTLNKYIYSADSKKSASVYTKEFEQFWEAYGRKGSKSNGFKRYKEARKKYSPEQILKALEIYNQELRDEKFRKYAEGWLNSLLDTYIEKIDRPELLQLTVEQREKREIELRTEWAGQMTALDREGREAEIIEFSDWCIQNKIEA